MFMDYSTLDDSILGGEANLMRQNPIQTEMRDIIIVNEARENL